MELDGKNEWTKGLLKRELKLQVPGDVSTVMDCAKFSLSKIAIWLEFHCPQGGGATTEPKLFA